MRQPQRAEMKFPNKENSKKDITSLPHYAIKVKLDNLCHNIKIPLKLAEKFSKVAKNGVRTAMWAEE